MRQRGERITYLAKRGCDDLEDNHSRRTYVRGATAFTEWLAETHSIKYTGQLQKAGYDGYTELIRQFAKGMTDGTITKADGKAYSAVSISTYCKGACHALGVDYKEINRDGIIPKRTADRIRKGTGRGDAEANSRGREQLTDPRFERFVLLARVTGARRSELAKIRGRNLVRDESGELCVEIESGKGGKHQLQRIMPWEVDAVKSLFNGVKPKDFVLSKPEIRNKIDTHYIRAKRSQDCYDYYRQQIRDGKATQLREQLIRRWQAEHIHGDSKQDRQAFERFKRDLFNEAPYKLRGANKQTAMLHNRPVEYSRLAMMAVSVYCLSHWRLDVTSTAYLSR